MVSWMSDTPLVSGAEMASRTPRERPRAMVKELQYRVDVNTLHRDEEAVSLGLNEIGRIQLWTTSPMFSLDRYRRNRATGGFILIDEASNNAVGAGMVVRHGLKPSPTPRSPHAFGAANHVGEPR